MTREADIERPASAYAEARGWFQIKIMRASKNGFPDRLYIRSGRVIFIEFKSPIGKPSAQQLRRHAEMRAAGAEVYVIDNLDEAKRVLV